MRRLPLTSMLVLVLLVVLALAPVTADAKKPAASLSGEMTIYFDPSLLLEPPAVPVCPPGEFGPIFWYGTVAIDGQVYGMTFESLGASVLVGETNHYREHFVIYEGDEGQFDDFVPGTCPATATPVLAGDLDGVGRFANSKLVENGIVTTAQHPFEEWDGRRMHADGVVTEVAPGIPAGFMGTIRFN